MEAFLMDLRSFPENTKLLVNPIGEKLRFELCAVILRQG
jgi:hypothetical protein